MKSIAQSKLKRARAVELVAAGKSYDEVAEAVGYSHRGSAHRAVFKALSEREVAGVEELRAVEVARLDALQEALWDQAMAGDASAASAILRVIEQRSRLLGLVSRNHPSGDVRGPQFLVRPPEGNPGEATRQAT